MKLTMEQLNSAWEKFNTTYQKNMRFGQFLFMEYGYDGCDVFYELDNCMAYNKVYEDILA